MTMVTPATTIHRLFHQSNGSISLAHILDESGAKHAAGPSFNTACTDPLVIVNNLR